MSTVLSDLWPNLALSSSGWVPLWLLHKFEKKKPLLYVVLQVFRV
jgi:hypothetical protein